MIFSELSEFSVETISPAYASYSELNNLSGASINAATMLDELARLFFQINQVILHNPHYEKILKLSDFSKRATISSLGIYAVRELPPQKKESSETHVLTR